MKSLSRKHLSQLLATAAAFAALSCSDRSTPTSPRSLVPRGSSKTISDGAHGGNPDVWFLPPMVPSPVGKPGYGNAFDPNVAVAIKIKDVTTNTYVVGAPSAVTVSLTDQLYQANWDTKNPVLSLVDIYRVEVQVNGKTVAYADIDVVSAGQLKNATTGDVIALPDGRTLPIKVRIEQGLVLCANAATCTSTTVPASIATDTKVQTPDGLNWITFPGGGNWNNQGVAVVVTIEDVSSQFGNTPVGCAQGLTNVLTSTHCLQITTTPQITLSRGAVVCMTVPGYLTEWQMVKYSPTEQTQFLRDPPASTCPPNNIQIGSTNQASNPLIRLASRVGNALVRLVTPTLAYAFDLGVGGSIDAGGGFSFFAPGRPAQMQSVAGDNQSGLPGSVLPIAPAVQIVNTHHNSPVGGAIVTCTVTAGGGSLAAQQSGQATENPTGTYTCPSWKLGTVAGTNTIKVTANILDAAETGGSVTFTATSDVCPGSLCITSLTPSSSNVILESADPLTSYSVTIHNGTGTAQTGVFIQGLLDQPGVEHGAGGTVTTCPSAPTGTVPVGDCTMTHIISASNLNGGEGTLVPGPATFVLELLQGIPGTLRDTKTIAVNLLAPPSVTISVSPQTGIVDVGNTLALTATVTAAAGVSTAVSWTSSNTAVATVSAAGVVTGVGVGNVSITARSRANLTQTASVPITVQAAGSGAFIASLGLSKAAFANGTNPSGQFTVTVVNSTGSPMSSVAVQGIIVQGDNQFPSGGTNVTCTPTSGLLPTGSCVFTFPYSTSNTSGPGPFVPGPATFTLQLYSFSDGTVTLDTKSVAVTITP